MLKTAPLIDIFFKGETLNRRAELIAECGFDSVETWRGDKPEELKQITSGGVKLISTLINKVPENDVAPASPEAHAAFLDRIDRYSEYALEVGCTQAIVTAGNQIPGKSYQAQRAAVVEVLAKAGEMLKSRGFSINLEPLNTEVNHPGYLLSDPNDAVSICRETGCSNVKVLYDIYHMAIMTGNLTEFIRHNINYIGHFHVAAVPGRHEPAAGETNYPFLLSEIEKLGYNGYIGFEYMPLLESRESLLQTRKYFGLE